MSKLYFGSPVLPAYPRSSHGLKVCHRHIHYKHRKQCKVLAVQYDIDKETSRTSRRTLFTLNDWKRHRSGTRYWHHCITIIQSGVVRGVVRPMLYVIALSTVVAVYNGLKLGGFLPFWVPCAPAIAIEPIQLTSFALSLLLVFRTNSSYSRWVEARQRFGAITTTARDLTRQALAWFKPGDYARKARLVRWLVALARCVMVHLRDEHVLEEELDGVLEAKELTALSASNHRPSYCLQMLSHIILRAGLPQELVLRMDENISKLVEAVSSCERIMNTPIPLSYTRHTARFLMLWLAFLPFSLWRYCGWSMIPIAALIAFVLLGIEEIGVYIEEPFTVLPLEHLTDRMTRIVNNLLTEHEAVAALERELSTHSEDGNDGWGQSGAHQHVAQENMIFGTT